MAGMMLTHIIAQSLCFVEGAGDPIWGLQFNDAGLRHAEPLQHGDAHIRSIWIQAELNHGRVSSSSDDDQRSQILLIKLGRIERPQVRIAVEKIDEIGAAEGIANDEKARGDGKQSSAKSVTSEG